jgi:hypothetical protein
MAVPVHSSVSSSTPPSGEAHSAGGAVHPDVLVGPVDMPSQTPITVPDDGGRWFGAGGLAVRPPRVLAGPVDTSSQTPIVVLDDGGRWFGAGGLAVRPPGVLAGPVDTSSQTPIVVLDDGGRWFGAGGLAVRPRADFGRVRSRNRPITSALPGVGAGRPVPGVVRVRVAPPWS